MSATVNLSEKNKTHGDLVEKVLKDSGVNVRKCYQCGKCSAGCQMSFAMDYSPNRVLRLVQLGMEEEVLNSRAIWMCALCSTCTARCPRDVDLPRVMDALRITAKKRGITDKFKEANIFHDSFMNSIAKYGRLYEIGLMAALNLKTGRFFDNVEFAMPAINKGKIHFLPPKTKGAAHLRKIISNCKRMEGEG